MATLEEMRLYDRIRRDVADVVRRIELLRQQHTHQMQSLYEELIAVRSQCQHDSSTRLLVGCETVDVCDVCSKNMDE